MKIYKNLRIDKKFTNASIAIGNFDGVHLGHQKVLNEAKLKAKKSGSAFGVVTFEPVPKMFFNKRLKNHRINNLRQKVYYLEKNKVDFLIVIKFNKKFSKLSPDNFIENILFNKIGCKFIFVSQNFRFGKNREGGINKLKKDEKIFNYKTIVTKPLSKKTKSLSSSIIRGEISNGNINVVNEFLGRNWCIQGKVIKGRQMGRKIGFPTCNIKIEDYVIPKLGVYSVFVKGKNFSRKGIANIGYRPTFKGKTLLLEVNIFGLNMNLYNKDIEVYFIKFIRPEKKFKGIEQLKVQIKKDIKKAKK